MWRERRHGVSGAATLRPQWPVLAAMAALGGVMVGSWLVTADIRSHADAASDRATDAAHFAAHVASTEIAENKEVRRAAPTADPAVAAMIAHMERDFTTLGDPAAQPILARYTAAARSVAALLGSGDVAGARRVEESEQGPAADDLLVETGRFAEVLSARASQDLRRADRLSLATHLGTLGLVGGVFALLWLVDGRAERDRQ